MNATVPAAGATIDRTEVNWRNGAVLGLLVAAYLAMAEVNRLTADVLDGQGRSWPLASLMGPSRLFDFSVDGWIASGFTTDQGNLFSWLLIYLTIDLVFIVSYGYLLAGALGRTWPVIALVIIDLAENVVVAVFGRPALHTGWAWAPVLFSFLKWVAVLVVVLYAVRRLVVPGAAGYPWVGWLTRLRRALYLHRFSILPLLPVAVLGLVSGPNLLDQLPDIERQWADSVTGHWQAAAAIATVLLLTVGLFVLGRTRSDFARIRAAETAAENDARPEPALSIYLVGPVLVVVGIVANGFQGIQGGRALVFAGVPLLIAAGSFALRRWGGAGPRPALRGLDPADVPVITVVGDVLAILPIVIGSLALVRSYTAVLVLAPLTGGSTAWAWGAMVLGVAGASAGWLFGARLLDWLATRPWLAGRLTVGVTTTFSNRLRWGALAFWLLVLLALYVAPLVAARLGVIACVLLAVAALALLVGSIVVIAQDGGAPEVFWRFNFRAAPITLLLLAGLLLASRAGSDNAVHGTRNLLTGPTERISFAAAHAAWATGAGCQVNREGVTLRPMFLVAAEGGGIRAAYWTAKALDRLVDESECAAASTLFAGGASGGAVGLTVSRFAVPATSAAQVERMAAPTGLAAAAVGLVVRDTLFAASGVPAPALGDPQVSQKLAATGSARWADRAALLESVWQTQAGALDTGYLGDPSAASHPTGQLVLTSTSVGTGCRYLVSQVTFDDQAPDTDCAGLDQPVAGSVDLFGAYAGPGPGAQHCVGPVYSATAAMFASRFPFVTPSGVIGPCPPASPLDQLVDGGYVENTGLGTITDLARYWLPLVRDANTRALQGADPVLVVPVVLYLDNGTGSDLRPSTVRVTDEILVPTTAGSRAKVQQSDAATLLQRAAALSDVDGLWDASLCDPGAAPADPQRQACERARAARAAVTQWRTHPAYVVHQSTFPAVTAPLGWTLSRDSITTMNDALEDQARTPCPPSGGNDILCVRGYGSLADALALLP